MSCLIDPVGFSALTCYCYCYCDENMHVPEGRPEEAMSDADDLARIFGKYCRYGRAKVGKMVGGQWATGNRRGYDDTTPAGTRIPRR